MHILCVPNFKSLKILLHIHVLCMYMCDTKVFFKISCYCTCILICFLHFIALPNGPPPIRLVGGSTSHEGRVEIFIEVSPKVFIITY